MASSYNKIILYYIIIYNLYNALGRVFVIHLGVEAWGKGGAFPYFCLMDMCQMECDEGHSPSSDVFIVNQVLDVTMAT